MIPLQWTGVLALAARPDLWPTAVRVGWRMATPGWWRRLPLRPWPSPAYLKFRLETMYGGPPVGAAGNGPGGAPSMSGAELVRYLEWCRRLPGRSR
jgi:hypothetical protein